MLPLPESASNVLHKIFRNSWVLYNGDWSYALFILYSLIINYFHVCQGDLYACTHLREILKLLGIRK